MRFPSILLGALVGSLVLAASAGAQGPPPPTAANGAALQTLAQGIPTPTQFAWAGSTLFAAAGGSEEPGGPPGGVFLIKGGTATRVPGSPAAVFGIAWRKGKLYITTGPKLQVWTGWNGTKFKKHKTLHTLNKKSAWWNGIAFGPGGRIYAGIGFGDKDEFTRAKSPAINHSWVSIKPNGKDLRVLTRGLRQPWMTTFVKGKPFVSVLAQDNTDPPPPDWVVSPRKGQDYGYPKCTRAKPKPCKGYAKPLVTFPNHASPMGLGAIGKRLYIALFGGLGTGPEVVSVPLGGGQATPFLTGYAAPVLAIGTHKGWLYTGDLTGAVYRVKP
jgi:glucose/arabinose dehydrogenase